MLSYSSLERFQTSGLWSLIHMPKQLFSIAAIKQNEFVSGNLALGLEAYNEMILCAWSKNVTILILGPGHFRRIVLVQSLKDQFNII